MKRSLLHDGSPIRRARLQSRAPRFNGRARAVWAIADGDEATVHIAAVGEWR